MTDHVQPSPPGSDGIASASGDGGSVYFPRPCTARRPPDTGGEPAPVLAEAAVQSVLDGLPGSVTLLLPVRGADGTVADFRIAAASPEAVDIGARRGKELIGLSVAATYPTVVGSALWEGYLRALRTGLRYEGEPFEYEEVLAGIPRLSRFAVLASASHGGLIVSWVRLDNGEREQRRLAVMQRLGGMGWADWDLVRNTATWSEHAYSVFGRDRSAGPMALDELPAHVVGEDRVELSAVVEQLLGTGRSVDHTFRLTTPRGEVRHVRIVAESERDAHGHPVAIHGFFQDLTAAKRAQAQLLESQQAALAHRSQLTAERDVAERLQHALLPLAQQSLSLAGLTVDVAYHPLQEGLNVGGDWYSAIELPDGSALLVIGDVAGHGLDAVATMAQLRFTAKGMAITGMPLPAILTRLNTLLLHTAERSFSTATMIMAHYEPATSKLTWVQAGHPPPLLLRRGSASYLSSPPGILLGAVPAPRYEAASTHLRPGDQLLLYTDGLIERPREDLDTSLARLARAAVRSAAEGGALDGILNALVDPVTRRDDVCALHVSLRSPAAPHPAVPASAVS
ncbi:PP2C family protein-serine/threonine phosphatase [Streptomyces sp. 2P-4]|uniref:PP2C family protein-serine/threonine phosphatase n=1 Tax=Streptomyces sp. 2P-4 TaxID=2931974 RepID=UPI002541997A|nr:PP2C family protein-serine/threonine phosphatase [Streptomyces sp. 2P-4]